jgi:hypothetical protein
LFGAGARRPRRQYKSLATRQAGFYQFFINAVISLAASIMTGNTAEYFGIANAMLVAVGGN